ncbi:MAG: hypothetical protein U0R19_24480 [Bryobacteraceae bacterium]
MKHLVLAITLVALAGYGTTSCELEERINTADEFSATLLSGFYQVEEHSWRWTKPSRTVTAATQGVQGSHPRHAVQPPRPSLNS